jgi:hypothetical protein
MPINCGQMGGATQARRGEGDLFRLRFCSGNEVFDRGVRAGGRCDHQVRRLPEHVHIDQAFERVVRQLFIDRRVRRVGRRLHQQRVAIGRRIDDNASADQPARAGTIFDDHWLLPQFG